ncbi:hypothetical protein MHIB_12490 [Mycolicibacter hiberniae]|uniref:Uncharacterized protein n=1 Tax=Mycolicibacter hiberniae TaxID=29314 RepID=A0A7I7X1Y9_9MYCO|nr:hypothetical protein MHIB_12490 [Mycolicibacter hiberniae]
MHTISTSRSFRHCLPAQTARTRALMRSQLLDHTLDHTHRDWLLTALTLPEDLDSNTLDSVNGTHDG